MTGIHPLLTGTLLRHLDAMGHGDAVLVADAHFPAERLGRRVVDLPGVTAPELTAAICTVLPLDSPLAARLMATDGSVDAEALAGELLAACAAPAGGWDHLAREDFYAAGADAFVLVRTGEVRPYGNLLLHKGLVR
ncbi:RbsD/FucU family protein [Cellulomonas sp. KRMCY2]|uniref:RbsD/FucU family protein n=1 Tax=Cellulomonas sp. KRMCY2 TaxID=1304865 RepID=UPI0004BCD7D3|nr:RbsD/FucU domain-containing protein [Cellulomonas sp. KRMCY2]